LATIALRTLENGQKTRFGQKTATQDVNFGHNRPEIARKWSKITLSAGNLYSKRNF